MTTFLSICLLGYVAYRLGLYLKTRVPGSPFAAFVVYVIVADLVFFGHWVKARAWRGRKGTDWDEEMKKL